MTKTTKPKQIITNWGILFVVAIYALIIFAIKTQDQLVKLRVDYQIVMAAQAKDQDTISKHNDEVAQYQCTIAELKQNLNEESNKFEKLHQLVYNAPADHVHVFNLTISAYTASKRECGKADGITATMEHVHPGKTCAVSRDLDKLLGKKIYIAGIGTRYVNDLMADYIHNGIDLNMKYVDSAMRFGKAKNRVLVLD